MPSQPVWPVVLFDLDGTLADTVPLIVASYRHAFETVLGVDVPESEILPYIGLTLTQVFSAWERPAELEAVYREFNLAHMDQMVRPYPGVREVVEELAQAGVIVGVVTAKRRDAARRSLDAVGYSQDLLLAACFEDTPKHKPDPAPLLSAMAHLRVPKSSVAYVGDAIYDVQAAKAAGVAQISVLWGAGDPDALAAEGPTAVVSDAGQLRSLLLG